MIEPPRRTESLLDALGAKTEFREAMLGDLAEEFAERAGRDGAVAARRWYYREAVRATPHFLRDWARGVHARDLTHLLGIVMASWVTTMMLAGLFVAVIRSVLWASGLPWAPRFTLGPLFFATSLVLALLVGTLGGYVAAWLHGKAPLIGALAVGVVWSCINVTARLIVRDGAPLWYGIAAPPLLIIGTMVGGALRVWSSIAIRSHPPSAPVSGAPTS